MERGPAFRAFAVVVVLAALGLAVWAFIRAAVDEPAIVGSVVTVVGGFLGVQWQQRRVETDRLAQVRRDEIAPTYRELIEWFRVAGDTDKPTSEQEQFFVDLQNKLLLFGPAPVLQAWASGMRTVEAAEEDGDPKKPILAYAGILKAIRADLGHDDNNLATRDLLRVFINDIDEHFPE
jgi:hypothetical protein